MHVQEFAERVLLGDTLDEKLVAPGKLTFGAGTRRLNVGRLESPGRPQGLQMHRGPGASKPPAESELERIEARGRLLHFLANHELLATELMALVLLRYPDAPEAFQRGVLGTLQEEQHHTRMYLERMRQCGIEFGSFPLSGHFWRVVEPMRSPLDFVSRLSLTFEQANLDYSMHFATVFHRLGDTKTASILERIYRDEIGHVQHGLHWFRKWKDPQQNDWEAYRAQLHFPMSPERARGPKGVFNRAGRLEAGLSAEFIDQVEVFRQSRGRTPTVRWFNAGAEAELAGPLSHQDERLIDQLNRDLELVMVMLSKRDDVLLTRRPPSLAFRQQLLTAGVELPEIVLLSDRKMLGNRKLHDLQPWAWTPTAHTIATELAAVTHCAAPLWPEDGKRVFRKSWAAERLAVWLNEQDLPEWITGSEVVAQTVASLGEVQRAISMFADRGYTTAILKQDLATAGRGQRRVRCDAPLAEQDQAWFRAMLERGCGGLVEPELDRLLDLSFLWNVGPNAKLESLGWTRQLVTQGRRYAGTRLGRPFSDCDDELSRFLFSNGCARLHWLRDWLAERIGAELIRANHRGNFGVDAFLCKHPSGQLQIKPLCELNPRTTMGHVALRMEPKLAPGVIAEFRILQHQEWEASRLRLREFELAAAPDGRLRSGVVMLGEVEPGSLLVPLLAVGSEAIDLLPTLV